MKTQRQQMPQDLRYPRKTLKKFLPLEKGGHMYTALIRATQYWVARIVLQCFFTVYFGVSGSKQPAALFKVTVSGLGVFLFCFCCVFTSDTTEYGNISKCVATKTVCTMDASGYLASCI